MPKRREVPPYDHYALFSRLGGVAGSNLLELIRNKRKYNLTYFHLKISSYSVPNFPLSRFDSFSKILSSGIRLGFVTGPRPLIERLVLHMQVDA